MKLDLTTREEIDTFLDSCPIEDEAGIYNVKYSYEKNYRKRKVFKRGFHAVMILRKNYIGSVLFGGVMVKTKSSRPVKYIPLGQGVRGRS